MLILYLLLIIASYFIGAIPSGVVLARAFSGKDIRQEGSGNIGATNVTRVLGKKLGALTLVGDLLKGFLPVCIGSLASPNVACLMGFAAFLGHLFPVYLGFKGGKGVATALGVFLYFAPLVILIEIVVFIAVVGIWRYVSLGSLVAAATMPLFLFAFPKPVEPVVVLLSIAFALLIFIKHKANIQRLFNGTENKFGTKKE